MAKKKQETKILKLDIACGQRKTDGFTGVDIAKVAGVDIVYDLNKYPWKFAKSNSVDEVICSHYIEHVPDLMKFMNELHRIMKPGAQAVLLAPFYASNRAFQDPTHVRFICENTMLYYNREWREREKLDHYPITADFDFNYGYHLAPEWATRSEEAKQFAIKHYLNVVSDIQFTLTKK